MTEKNQQRWDYCILSARVLLAWTLLSYGWGKLSDGQFGVSSDILEKPVKDVSLFKLSWYLFAQQPFKAFVGISQIMAALLLLYNRTLILGALLAIPIFANILVIDITYLKMPGFYWRISYYLVLIFLILWHYKDRMIIALNTIVGGLTTKFKYPIWAYLILPLMALVLELLGVIPQILVGIILNPVEGFHGLWQFIMMMVQSVKNFFS